MFLATVLGCGLLTPDVLASEEPKERKSSLRVAMFNAPPIMELTEDNQRRGFMVELLEEMAKKEGWEIQWVHLDWPEAIPRTLNNDIDLIPFIAYSETRAELLDYNEEGILTGWGQVYTHFKEPMPENIFGLEGRTIGIIKNEVYGIKIANLCELFNIECNFIEVSTYREAFELLSKRSVAGVVTSNLVSYGYDNELIRKTPIVFEPRKVLFATAKNANPQLLKTIDRYTRLWRFDENSIYYQLKDKYLREITHEEPLPPWILYTLLIILGLLLLAALIVYLLRKQVKVQTQDLEDQSDQIRQIINLVPHMIFASNANGKLILANRYAANFFGINMSDIEGYKQKDLISQVPKAKNLFEDEQLLLRRDAHAIQREVATHNVEGQKITLKISKVPFVTRYSRIPSVVTVGVDITEAKEYEKQIQHMAQHDSLTQLPNRLLLNDRIHQSLALTQRYEQNGAVLFIDLDYFKNINDSLGHMAGDNLLQEVAKRLKGIVREGDTVARLGGDEFIIQLSQLDRDAEQAERDACLIAEKINFALAQEYQVDGQKLFSTASIGIVIYPRDANTEESIIQRADTAMYYAKSMGRNRYAVFKREMEKVVVRNHMLERELRKALVESRLLLRFQPQITSDNDEFIGVEALLRWNHPSEGIISPAEFIPIAEENHLIIPIGEWVLKKVCYQIKYWLQQYGASPFITVNLSAVQIRHSDLVSYIKKLLDKTKIPPSLLELEVTETVLLHEARISIDVLQELKKLGVRLSIDDFGTGYSSLTYLKKLPLDKLKIDRSFIKDIPGDPDSETIIRTVIGMSHDLGLEVIAEGVETKEQLDYLRKERCSLFQGFYFDPPITIEQIEEKYFAQVKQKAKAGNTIINFQDYSKK
ncbi:EAL domain-containing protein [Kangiella sediminilitoris]|uniref:EAL domain-containing protein n=1 Tax=Kangiella sediminilitoris TaxID=1144748 RepID=UPI001E39697F|nr:EAL domain-containing protein [Kangiella sediminilitoris]